MCSYDFTWHPDVKDGEMYAVHCVLHDAVCVFERVWKSFILSIRIMCQFSEMAC